MSGRGWLGALALSLLAHGLVLAAPLVPPPPPLWPPPPRLTVAYRARPVAYASLDVPLAPSPAPPRAITIRRQRTVHLPPQPRRPARRAAPVARPVAVSAPVAAAAVVPRVATTQRTPSPLLAALRRADEQPLTAVEAPGGAVWLALPGPADALADVLAWPRAESPGLLIVADLVPAFVAPLLPGESWRPLPDDDPLLAEPVGAWWREADGEAWLGAAPDGRPVVWLSVAARAGWEARRGEALALWDRLLADERWQRRQEGQPR